MSTPVPGEVRADAVRGATSRRVIAAVIVVLLATVVAVLIGIDDRADGDRSGRAQRVDAVVGEPVRVGAVVVTVLSIEAAPQWDDRSEYADGPVTARDGATVVVVRYRVERDAALQLSCTSRLLVDPDAADQQEWDSEAYGDRLAGPEGLTYCSAPFAGPGDGSIVVEGYEVPERYADRVVAAIDVDDTRVVVGR